MFKHNITRRSFVKSGMVGVLAASMAPRVVPSRVLGQNAPSKRVTLGFIGVGTHGHGVNLKSFLQQDDCQVLAVCDVFASRRDGARKTVDEHYGGSLTDWGAHLVDTAQVANFAEESGPTAVEGSGNIPPDTMNTVPHTYKLSYVYANGVTLEVKSGGTFIRFEGTEGWVGSKSWSGPLEASDMEIFRRKYDPNTNKIWPRRPREQRDFLDCIKNGQPPMYTAEALHRLSTTLHIGAIAMELGRPLKWDPVTESSPDDPAANTLRSRPSREDWRNA